MKKLSLKNAKTLSRKEMKAISGGYLFLWTGLLDGIPGNTCICFFCSGCK